jgi:glycosyltransferase involved in cell wall biosynthesis
MAPLVSVIIPTYNRAAFILKALQSVREQTYKFLEIIVIDDGSTDKTREMLNDYDGQLHYFFQENKGISGARNAGIRNAHGEYIAFLDSDDYWVPEKTEQQVALFEQNHEYGLVASRCASIRLNGSYRERNRPGKSGWILEDLFKANFIRTSAAMVRKQCFERIGLFDEDLKECEEYDLWLRIAAFYPMGFINKSLAVYFDNPDGVSTDSLTGRLYRLKVLEKKYLQDKIPAPLYARRIANTCHYIGRHYIKRGEKKKGFSYLFKAQRLRPLYVKNFVYVLLSYFNKK